MPTKFYSTPTEVFRSYGFAAVIWANHLLRSSIAAMASTAELLHREQNLHWLEDRISEPLAEVFRLQGADELQEAERRYLPDPSRRTAAVVLAASRGPELGQLTEKIPKAMVTIAGKPLLAHIAEAYQRRHPRSDGRPRLQNGERQRSAHPLRGEPRLRNHRRTGLAGEGTGTHHGPAVGHRLLRRRAVSQVYSRVAGRAGRAIRDCRRHALARKHNRHRHADYVCCSVPSKGRQNYFSRVDLVEMSERLGPDQIDGEWMGFLKISAAGLPTLREILAELLDQPANLTATMSLLVNELLRRGHGVRVLYMTGHWLDVDSLEDVIAAAEVVR